MTSRIGFMQGRLSDLVDNKIQSFPWDTWEDEFEQAVVLDLRIMEWTIDEERLSENPLMTREGQSRIKELSELHGIRIPSLTGDCFIQAPFWKAPKSEVVSLQREFLSVAISCIEVGIGIIVVPLVDNGRITESVHAANLASFLLGEHDFFFESGLKVVFEADLAPNDYVHLIDQFPTDVFGVNYDIGNSAASGFDPVEELASYGSRILNVHVKDRQIGGVSVPLGSGNADFGLVFRELVKINYLGNYIMQTSRATDRNHGASIRRYKRFIEEWLCEVGVDAV